MVCIIADDGNSDEIFNKQKMKEASKIKVLEICGGLSTEGIGVFLLNTFENIDREKFEIHFALATKYKQVFENQIISNGGKIHRTYEIGDGMIGKLKHGINLYKLIKKEKYEVVHSHMDFFNGLNLLVAFLARVPLRISHAHVANNHHPSFLATLYYWVMRNLISLFSNKKLGCSVAANQFVNKQGKVIFNGINIQKFRNKEQPFPENIVFDEEKKNIATVGRIDDAKNPFFIVNIIEELKKINRNFHFYWIGFGSLSKEVEQLILAKNLENEVSLLGTRNDVEKILNKMDVFILPSKYEGFGIVLAEAQAAGLPCLISENVPSDVNVGLCKTLELEKGEKNWALQINEILYNFEEPKSLNFENIDIRNTIIQIQNEYKN